MAIKIGAGLAKVGKAAELCRLGMAEECARIGALRDRLNRKLHEGLDELYINGSTEHRLPGNLNISFAYVEGESLLMGINDVAVSSGSACTSASLEPSYVLKALGAGDELAHSSIRFGLGRFNTEEEVDFVVEKLSAVVVRLPFVGEVEAGRWSLPQVATCLCICTVTAITRFCRG